MKNNVMRVLFLLTIFSNSTFGQDVNSQYSGNMDKTNWVNVQPLVILLGGFGGTVGKFLDDGSSEIVFPISLLSFDEDHELLGEAFSPGESFYLLSAGVKYRMYKNKNGRGLYLGGKYNYSYIGITVNMENQYYDYDAWVNGVNTEKIIASANTFGFEVGTRSITKIGFTIAPRIGYDISIASIGLKSDGTEYDGDTVDQFSGGGITLGLEMGWMF